MGGERRAAAVWVASASRCAGFFRSLEFVL